jgi:methylmalonyl-CoA/ethylmalonyl-CoA epimerase
MPTKSASEAISSGKLRSKRLPRLPIRCGKGRLIGIARNDICLKEREMLKKIDHIAIVVKDVEAALKNYEGMFGFKVKTRMDGPGGEFKAVHAVAGDITLEFLQPLKPGTAFARFLEERGGGLHHVSFATDDITGEMKNLKARGKKLQNDEPMTVPGGDKIAFVHPSTGENVLIELVQRGK